MFSFLYHYKLPFDVYAHTFDMCTNKVYLLTYLLVWYLVVAFDSSIR